MNDSQLHFLVSFVLTAIVMLLVLRRKNGVLPFLGMSGSCFAVIVCFIIVGSKEVADLIVNRWHLSQYDLVMDCLKDLFYDVLGIGCGGAFLYWMKQVWLLMKQE